MKPAMQRLVKNPFFYAVAAYVIFSVSQLSYGLPLHLVGDEESLVGGAMKMLELHSFIPSLHPIDFDFLYYPVGIPYLIILSSLPLIAVKFLALGFSVSAIRDFFILYPDGLWIAARAMTFCASLVLLFMVYRLAELLFNKRVAGIAVVLLATSFLHANASLFVRHWMLATLCIYSAIYVTVRYVKQRDLPWWLPAVAVSMASAISYIALISVPIIAGYCLYHRKRIQNFPSFCKKSATIFLLLSAFFIGLHASTLVKIVGNEDGSGSAAKSIEGIAATVWYGVRTLLNQDLFIIISAILAILFVPLARKKNTLFIVLSIGYFMVLYVFFHIEVRYVYVVVPILAIAAGSFVEYLIATKRIVPLTLVVIGFAYSLASFVQYHVLLGRADTRNEAVSWIETTMGSREFILSSDDIQLFRSRAALERDSQIARLRAAERYSLSHEYLFDSSNPTRFNFTNLHFWNDQSDVSKLDEYILRFKPEFFILETWNDGDISQFEKKMVDRSALVQKFTQASNSSRLDVNGNFFVGNYKLFSLDRLGPAVYIYRIEE